MARNRHARYRVHFGRGEAGLRALGPDAAVIVIVDVLSFSTAVDVALRRGAAVLPYRYRDPTASDVAEQKGAYLAVPRDARSAKDAYTLSPGALAGLPFGSRLVLPSPNGAVLTIAAGMRAHVIVACLRNARAVARYVACHAGQPLVAVIAAGERNADGSARDAREDDLGAGAVIDALDIPHVSAEALDVAADFAASRHRLDDELRSCASATELIEAGFANDVSLASELNVSETIPSLRADGFIADIAPATGAARF